MGLATVSHNPREGVLDNRGFLGVNAWFSGTWWMLVSILPSFRERRKQNRWQPVSAAANRTKEQQVLSFRAVCEDGGNRQIDQGTSRWLVSQRPGLNFKGILI